MKLSENYNLKVFKPELAEQWHPTKNGALTPDQVTPNSGRKVWWLCPEGHEWQASVDKRSRGNQCPYCAGARISEEYNLATVFPGIAEEWHPTKNGDLRPDHVAPFGRRRVWWLCKKGHEWEAQVDHKSNGAKCPYCNSRKATRDSNLQVSHPELAAQWHPIKNGDITPAEVTCRSRRIVWWMCDKEHEWQDRIVARKDGNDCPYCYGIEAIERYNFAAAYPDIAREWHPTKNGALRPDEFPPHSRKSVWWKCRLGHEWKANIGNRSQGCNCPYCHGRYASEDYNLEVMKPDLARQWHPTKNGKLTPRRVTPGSAKKVWWMCDKGHEWLAAVKYRHSTGCPFCSGKRPSKDYNLAVVRPDLAGQWHPDKNGELTPDKVTPGVEKKVWWLCSRGHEWQAIIGAKHRSGSGCPRCARLKRSKKQ